MWCTLSTFWREHLTEHKYIHSEKRPLIKFYTTVIHKFDIKGTGERKSKRPVINYKQ